jgi:hypothetical protein
MTWQISPGSVMMVFSQFLIASLTEHLDIPRTGSGPSNGMADACLASLSAYSLPRMPQCPGTQMTVYLIQAIFDENFFSRHAIYLVIKHILLRNVATAYSVKKGK